MNSENIINCYMNVGGEDNCNVGNILENKTVLNINEELDDFVDNTVLLNDTGEKIKFAKVSVKEEDFNNWNNIANKLKIKLRLSTFSLFNDVKNVILKKITNYTGFNDLSNKRKKIIKKNDNLKLSSYAYVVNVSLNGDGNIFKNYSNISDINVSGNNSNILIQYAENTNVLSQGEKNNIIVSDCEQFTGSILGKNNLIISSSCRNVISSSGYKTFIYLNGNKAADSFVSTSGDNSHIIANENGSNIATCGDNTEIIAKGEYITASCNGDNSNINFSGGVSTLSTIAADSIINNEGVYNTIISAGENSKVISKGKENKIAMLGDNYECNANGIKNIIALLGNGGTFKGKKGTYVAVAEYDYNDEYKCIGFVTGCIGKNGLKEDTEYYVDGGKFIEVKN